MDTPNIIEHLSDLLVEIRENHPSFKLMNNKIDESLFPEGIITFEAQAMNSNDELKTVKEIVEDSWNKRKKNHLMIEGEGGIGKTVTLLSLPDKIAPHPVSAIYIPLHDIRGTGDEDLIERYIKTEVLDEDEELFRQLKTFRKMKWEKGPALLLLLDGFNELSSEVLRGSVSRDIERWANYPGVQIITSSRYDIHNYVSLQSDFSKIELQRISKEKVCDYLDRVDMPIPTDAALLELITNPLLLTLYIKAEIIRSQRASSFARFRDTKNAGTLIWNYLQCELWRFRHDRIEEAKPSILAMEFIAPYIAWKMQQQSCFSVDESVFNELLNEAHALLEAHIANPSELPSHISIILQQSNELPQISHLSLLLKEHLGIFVGFKEKDKYGNDTVRFKLMHQQFRDALAAIYLINSIYLDGDSRPTEWDSTVDHYVVQFVADLISEDEANRLWEQNRTSPQLDSATRNQLELQSRLHNCDFSNLDFSGLDLSNISLYPYRVGNAMLKLPADSKRMTDTRLSEKTFYAEAHGSKVNAVTVPPDGKCIVSGSDDNTIRIWDLETGAQLRVIKGHINGVNAITVTPDRTRIISGSSDNTIRVWGWETESQIMAIEGHKSSVNAITVTPNGKCIVSGSKDSTIRIWDLENGAPIGKPLQGHEGSVNAITVTPDGKIIVSGSDDNTIRIWDLETGLQLRAIKGHKSSVNAITLTPDGKHIISGSSDKTIRIWDFGNGALVGEPLQGHEDWVNAVAVTPDSKLIVSGSLDNTIRVWDLETGVQLKIIKGYKEGYKSGVNTIALTLNNKREYIVSGFNHGAIQVWDLKTGDQLIAIEKYKRGVNAATISLDSKRIVSGSEDKTIRVWDLETRVLLNAFEGHKSRVNAVSLTPDGKYIVSGSDDKSIRVWSLETGAHLINIEGHEDIVKIVKVTPSGKHIISSSDDNTIRIWDLETGEYIRSLQGIKSTVYFIAITPNGKFVISEGRDHTIYIWDFETGCLVNVPKENDEWENSVAVMSSRNHFAYGVADGTIRIISKDTSSTHTIRVLPLSVVGLDFSKAEISDDELKETLRQNGAKV